MRKKISTNNNDKKYYKTRDHCYYTEKYRDDAHNV